MSKSFDELVTAIEDISAAIADDIDNDPKNDFGMTIGDELHSIEYQLSRIADCLEILTKQFIDNK